MNWDPPDDETEIAQNVRSLIVTAQGTVPLARALGLPTMLDYPEPVAAAKIGAALNNQITQYETRAEVASISVSRDDEGQLRPTVRLKP